jgi:hypothetical protein
MPMVGPMERRPFAAATSRYGVPADSLPHVDVVTPSTCQAIIDGKYINLAILLMPDSEFASKLRITETLSGELALKPHTASADSRVQRALTLPEFISAFSIYKTIMCEVYSERLPELDAYMREIIEMATKYSLVRQLPISGRTT